MPHEQEVITVRPHPATIFGPVALALAGLATAIALTNLRGFSHDARLIAWLVSGLLILYLVSRATGWATSWFVVTSERLLVVKGVVARDVSMIPLTMVKNMKFRRSFLGRIFGYGQFIMDPVGQDQALRYVNFIPYPEQLYLELCGVLFPYQVQSDDDKK